MYSIFLNSLILHIRIADIYNYVLKFYLFNPFIALSAECSSVFPVTCLRVIYDLQTTFKIKDKIL